MNAVLCSGFQSIGLFFLCFLVVDVEQPRFVPNWNVPCELMHGNHKTFYLIKIFGGDNFSIASVFFMIGLISSLLIMYLNYSTCLHANLHLSRDIARFSTSSFVRTVCNFCLCNSSGPFVIINMSSRYAFVFLQLVSDRSISFWNSAGMSVRPLSLV